MLGAVYLAQHRFLEALEPGTHGTTDASRRRVELRRHRRCGHRAGPLRRGLCGLRPHGVPQANGGGVRAHRVRARAAGPAGRRRDRDAHGHRGHQSRRIRKASRGPGRNWARCSCSRGDIDEASSGLRPGAVRVSTASLRAGRAGQSRRVRAMSIARWRAIASCSPRRRHRNWPRRSATSFIVVATSKARRSAWAQAERLERDGWKDEAPQPAALARLLAERDLQPQEALAPGARGRAGDATTSSPTTRWRGRSIERAPSSRPGRRPSARGAPARATAASCITRRRLPRRVATRATARTLASAHSTGIRSST